MKTTYKLMMVDSNEPADWMHLPNVSYNVGIQGQSMVGGSTLVDTCNYTASTTGDHKALEAAFDADEDVLSYEYIESICDEHEDCQGHEDLAVACAESRNA